MSLPLLRMFFPLLLLLIASSCNHCIAQSSADPLGNSCNLLSRVKKSSRVYSNIVALLPLLVSGTESDGYVYTSYGQNNDTVYGLAQCRGDVSRKDCSTCIQGAARQIHKLCPNRADGRIWYDYCFLRYSRENFAGKVDTSFGIYYENVDNVTDPKTFYKKLGALTDQIEAQAIVPKNKGLGKSKTKISPSTTLYALVQCTRDLSPASCSQCLTFGISYFPILCENRKGCQILYDNCLVRYEVYPFYFPLDKNITRA